MKLSLFNSWRDLTTWSGHTLQYQTSKKGDTWSTYIRDKETNAPITFGISRVSKDESQDRATNALKTIGIDGVEKAIATGQMVRPPSNEIAPKEPRNIEWRDGVNHSHKAHNRLVR